METLLTIHHELLTISVEKVELIKNGDAAALEALIRTEAKLARKIQINDTLRMKQVQAILAKKGKMKENATITDVKEFATEAEKEQLDHIQEQLLLAIHQLKTHNDLNQELITESLRFVNLSLDLIVPYKEDISYSRRQEDDDDRFLTGHSLFDSKA